MDSAAATEPRELVRLLRVEAGSHDRLAAAIGTSRQTIIRWENGAEPKENYRERLAALSGRDADDFRVRRQRSGDQSVAALLAAAERIELNMTRGLERLDEREQRVADQLLAQSQLLKELAAATAEMRAVVRDLQEAARPAGQKPA